MTTRTAAEGTPTGEKPDPASGPFGSLPQIVTVHAYDHVYRLLRHAIASRSMAPGTRAVESALAEQLHVSRTPVRDALRRLESDGLLIRTGNGGLEVVGLTALDIEDIFAVRGELDRLAAALACQRGGADDWRQVSVAIGALGPAMESFGVSSYEFSQAHEAVHSSIYQIAFTPVVAQMLGDRLLGLVDIASELSYTADGPDEPIVAQHLELLEAIASGNVERAMAAADRHCREAEEVARAGARARTESPGEGAPR